MPRSTPPATSVPGATAIPTEGRSGASLPELLSSATLEIEGRLAVASNATFLCRVVAGAKDSGPSGARQAPLRAVYKPTRGERPLDDFPAGTLAQREMAAYLLSQATGWGIVPPTVLRDGPLGPGMVQLWIDTDPEADVAAMIGAGDARLRRLCVFDVLANNADRKGGHLLPARNGRVYGVDHGICFAVEPKLRTVLWQWRGQKLDDAELAVVAGVLDALDGALGRELGALLDQEEVQATGRRAQELLRSGRFPQPDPGRPALPWPPF